MTLIHTFATLNINGVHSQEKQLLREFIRSDEVDILFLQEVVTEGIQEISGYAVYTSIGIEQRGTAIIIREGTEVNSAKRFPMEEGWHVRTVNSR